MDSRAKLLGHPVHQMLIVFPLGLLATALLFDLLHVVGDQTIWAVIAFWLIVVGVASGVVAALFGYVDWRAIPGGTRAKRIGGLHGAGNMVVLLLYGLSCLMRLDAPEAPAAPALSLSFLGGSIAMVTAWLGGELVDRLGVGVHAGAHLDAPSSLRGPIRR
jgi:uncharacterized membrane protein